MRSPASSSASCASSARSSSIRWSRTAAAIGSFSGSTPCLSIRSSAAWLRPGAVVLITGGLGGIGLTLAAHVARTARGARLVLVGRSPLPEESSWDATLARLSPDDPLAARIQAVRGLRSLGAEVMVYEADVTDRRSVEALAVRVRSRFGAVDALFHSAGVLNDALLALRETTPTSPVLDTKVKGTLVLDAVFGEEVETLVLFSSVSSILGLAGQAEYGAANAFLDAFAHARRRRGAGRTISINWNAWQSVGMAARQAREGRPHEGVVAASPPSTPGPALHPFLEELVAEDAGETLHRTRFDRARHWLVGEHVVEGGDALVPGTGYLELARAAFERVREHRPVELRDVVFLAPFVVPAAGPRALHVRVTRGTGPADIAFFSDREDSPHATAKAAYVDSPPPAPVDLGVVRDRCAAKSELFGGFTDQRFMAFGRRWANVVRVDYAASEALVTLALDSAFSPDLGAFGLHPALLDMATGGAQKLIPGFQPDAFYVPFSYERVLVRRALPARLFSHVRLRSSARDVATFDVTLLDEGGGEIADIRGFTMRRVAAASALGPADKQPTRARHETPLEAALREGMLPAEGMDALDRILCADPAPQVVASSVDVHAWLDALATDRVVAEGDTQTSAFERPELSASFLAPRTRLERELAAMWCELLGVDRVGVRDDFFELGGQSLVAVRLFARIRKKYGAELALSTLFEAPTIEGCAAVLAAACGIDDDAIAEPVNGATTPAALPKREFRSLVTIQRGDGRTPFFCVHGAGGNVLNFRDLSRAMGAAQPFYGLQARGIDGVLRPRDSIEEMASAYLDEVRSLQPGGPYLLAGYSGGGLVALEMARVLTDAGQRVDLLAFIDTFHPQMPVRRVNMTMRLGRVRDEGVAYLRGALEGWASRRRARQQHDEVDRLVALDQPVPPELRDLHLTGAFERVAARYAPRRWKGRAVLLRAEEAAYIYRDAGPAYGWEDVVSEVDIVRVPGNHANLLLEPNASVLTRSLAQAIEEAQRRSGPSAHEAAIEEPDDAPLVLGR